MQLANLFSLLTLLASSQASPNPHDEDFEFYDFFQSANDADFGSSLEPGSTHSSSLTTSSTSFSFHPDQINSSDPPGYFLDHSNWPYEYPNSDSHYENEVVAPTQPPRIVEEQSRVLEAPQMNPVPGFNDDNDEVIQTQPTPIQQEPRAAPTISQIINGPVYDPHSLSGFLTADEQIEWQHVVSAFTKVLNQNLDNKTMLEVLLVLVHEGLDVKMSESLVDMMSTEYGMVKILQDMIFQYRWSHGLFPYTQSHVEMFKYFTRLVALSDPQTIIGGFQERLQRCLSQTTSSNVKRDIRPIMSNMLHACGGHIYHVAHDGDPILESVMVFFEMRWLTLEERRQNLNQNYGKRAKYLVQKLYQQSSTMANVDWSSVTVEDVYLRLIQELNSIHQANLERQVSSSQLGVSSSSTLAPALQPQSSSALNNAPENTNSKKRKRGSSTMSSPSSSAPTSTNHPKKRRVLKRCPVKDVPPNAAANELNEGVKKLLGCGKSKAVASMRRVLYFFLTRYNVAVPRERLVSDCIDHNIKLFVTMRMVIKEYVERQGDHVEDENLEYVNYAIKLIEQPENKDIFKQRSDDTIYRYLKKTFG